MKKYRFGLRKKGKKPDARKLAAQLAPLEEQDKDAARKQGATETLIEPGSSQNQGAIVADSSKLPKGIVAGEEKKGFLGIEPVVLFIVSLMLAFIAFIAWHVSEMD